MKKIVSLALMMILLLLLCSCSMTMNNMSYERTRFVKVEDCWFGRGSIVVDTETNVEYWMSEGIYNTGTLTMLVDENGNPKIRK